MSNNKEILTPIVPVPSYAPAFEPSVHAKFLFDKYGEPSAVYTYKSQHGEIIGHIVRWNFVDEGGVLKKDVRPFCYCESPKGVGWKSHGFPKPHPLYHLDEIINNPSAPILICEGEKAADAAKILFPSYVATTSPFGSHSRDQADWTPLENRKILLCGDNDISGIEYVQGIYNFGQQAKAVSIQIFNLRILTQYVVESGQMLHKSRPVCKEWAEDKNIKAVINTHGFSWEDNPNDILQLAAQENSLYKHIEPRLPPGWDIADGLVEGWNAEFIGELEKILQDKGESLFNNINFFSESNVQQSPISLPYGYRIAKSGIEYLTILKIDKDTEVEEWTFMCSHLIVTAWTCDENGFNHGRILEYIDPKGIKKEYVMPMELLAGSGEELRKNLLSRGVCLASKVQARNKFLDYISSSKPTAKATCVDKIGWFKKQYILPEKVYGFATERVILQSRSSVIQKIEYSGTLEEWQQHIGRYIVDNPILYLSACAALAAPLSHLLRGENFAIHLSGSSSIGKTTAIHLARSMWGNEIHSWRTTDNAAESLARNANDGLLIFDELGEVDAKSADNMAYMLGNGSGKRRANRNGDAKPFTTFRAVILSTGEVGLEGKLNDIGKSQRAGQSVRFIEVYADMDNNHGIYKELHRFEDGAQLSNYLKQVTERYEGVVIDKWLSLLTQEDTQNAILTFIKSLKQEWAEKYVPNQADGQIQRCGQKFALLAAVGEVAMFFGLLLPYSHQQLEKPALGDLSVSINELFQSWISRRGGKHHDSYELTEVINDLRDFINQHGSSRFEADSAQKIHNRAGYRKTHCADGQSYYYFFQLTFEREILKGKDKKIFLKRLAEKGILQKDGEGKYTKSASFAGQKQQRYICIDSEVLNMQDEGE